MQLHVREAYLRDQAIENLAGLGPALGSEPAQPRGEICRGKSVLVRDDFVCLSDLEGAGAFAPALSSNSFKVLVSLDRCVQVKLGVQPWISLPQGRAYVAAGTSEIQIAVPGMGAVYAIELDNGDVERRLDAHPDGADARPHLFGVIDRLRSKAIGDCLRLLVDLLHDNDRDGAICICRSLRAAIADIVCGGIASQGPQCSQANGVLPGSVRRALRFIEQEAPNAIDTTSVASSVGISVRSLQMLFGRYLNISPSAYITQRRLVGVRRDIEQGIHRSVSDAAEHWGFKSPSHFARLYRAAFGERPSDTKKIR